MLGSRAFIVDACRHVVVEGNTTVLLATRPVLFTLARLLAQAMAPRCAAGHPDRKKHSARATATSRTGCACVSKSAGCAGRCEIGQHHRDAARIPAGAARRTQGRGAGASGRRAACGGAGFPIRRRGVVQLGAGHRAGRQPAHGAAGAGGPVRARQGAMRRPRPGTPLDGAGAAGVHDNLVTPPSVVP